MFVEAELKEVVHGRRGMLEGIKACLDRQCLVSALVLMYSTIDALSALGRAINKSDTNGNVFKEWVNDYIHPQKLKCSADDIWGQGVPCFIGSDRAPLARTTTTGTV